MAGRGSTTYCITEVQGLHFASVAAILASANLRLFAASRRMREQRVNPVESRLR